MLNVAGGRHLLWGLGRLHRWGAIAEIVPVRPPRELGTAGVAARLADMLALARAWSGVEDRAHGRGPFTLGCFLAGINGGVVPGVVAVLLLVDDAVWAGIVPARHALPLGLGIVVILFLSGLIGSTPLVVLPFIWARARGLHVLHLLWRASGKVPPAPSVFTIPPLLKVVLRGAWLRCPALRLPGPLVAHCPPRARTA